MRDQRVNWILSQSSKFQSRAQLLAEMVARLWPSLKTKNTLLLLPWKALWTLAL